MRMVCGFKRRQLGAERGQLVIMRGEQRAAAVDLVQMLERRPGDREPVEGRGAAADLVEDDEGARARLVEDRGGLDHLDHEGRAPAREIVGGADAAEQPVDHADMRRCRRHEAAHLRQHGDQRVLPQKRALAGHVGAGQEPEPAVLGEVAVVGAKGPRLARLQRRLDHRMPPALDLEGEAAIDQGPAPAPLGRELGQARRDIQLGQRLGRCRDGIGARRHLGDQRLEQRQLDRQRLVGGGQDLRFKLARARPW